jgi:hypothetical protein
MPFHPPFREAAKPNDLVYGLAKPRTDYRQNCPGFKEGFDVINNYRITQDDMKNHPEAPEREDEFLQHVAQHPKYSSILKKDFDPWGNPIDLHENEKIRRKCKAGLNWGTHDSQGTHVHFVLDSIGQEDVVKKSYWSSVNGGDSGTGDLKERAVTNAELRWIFRNRHDPQVAERVQFWKDMKPTLPPWEIDTLRSTWETYQPQSAIGRNPKRPAQKRGRRISSIFSKMRKTIGRLLKYRPFASSGKAADALI